MPAAADVYSPTGGQGEHHCCMRCTCNAVSLHSLPTRNTANSKYCCMQAQPAFPTPTGLHLSPWDNPLWVSGSKMSSGSSGGCSNVNMSSSRAQAGWRAAMQYLMLPPSQTASHRLLPCAARRRPQALQTLTLVLPAVASVPAAACPTALCRCLSWSTAHWATCTKPSPRAASTTANRASRNG
jgi:hypothetical protein